MSYIHPRIQELFYLMKWKKMIFSLTGLKRMMRWQYEKKTSSATDCPIWLISSKNLFLIDVTDALIEIVSVQSFDINLMKKLLIWAKLEEATRWSAEIMERILRKRVFISSKEIKVIIIFCKESKICIQKINVINYFVKEKWCFYHAKKEKFVFR